MGRKQSRMELLHCMRMGFSIFWHIFQRTASQMMLFWQWYCIAFTSLTCMLNPTKCYSSYCFLVESNPFDDSKCDLTECLVQKLHDIWPYCDMWHFGVCCSRWFIIQQYLKLSTENSVFLQKYNCASDNAIYHFWYRQGFSLMPLAIYLSTAHHQSIWMPYKAKHIHKEVLYFCLVTSSQKDCSFKI